MAAVEWRQTGDAAHFCVVARSPGAPVAEAVLARSYPLDWPPTGDESVRALSDAADRLAEAFIAAGWTPLPNGDAWYAKRFAWVPAAWVPLRFPPGSGTARFRRGQVGDEAAIDR